MGRGVHLVWRGSKAYWRRRLPHDLRQRCGRLEWSIALKTVSTGDAQRKARFLSVVTDQLIEQQRSKPEATAQDLERLAKAFFLEKLQEYERRYVERAAEAAADGSVGRDVPAALAAQITMLELFIKGLPSTAKAAVAYALLRDQKLDLPEELQWFSSRLYFRADLEASKLAQAHLKGDYAATPSDQLFAAAFSNENAQRNAPLTGDPLREAGSDPSSARKLNSPSISKFFSDYVARKIVAADDRWTEQTRLQNEMTFRLFTQFTNDCVVQDVDEELIVAFKDKLKAFPRNWGQNPKYRGKTLDEVIAIADQDDPRRGKRLVNKTINRHVSAIGGAFTDAKMRAEWKGANPCANLLERKGRRATQSADERRPYLTSELNRLFSAPTWMGCHSERFPNKPGSLIIRDHRYFVPLIALFSGMREDEICKLCTDDLRQVGQYWAMQVADTEFGRVKEESSVRLVPVHPVIQAAGFIKYVLDKKKQGRIHLWPKLRPGGPDKSFAHSYQKQFAATKKSIGIFDRGLTFHSFRHNFSIAMKDAGIDLAIREAVMGHKSHSMTDAVYGAARIHWIERRFESHRAAVEAVRYQGLALPFVS